MWALGWGTSNFGMKENSDLKEIVNNFTYWGLPLESVHTDLNLTINYSVFNYPP